MSLSRLRVEFAAEVFLSSMRRSFVARNPDEICPIKINLSEYSEADRGVLINAVENALKSSDKKNDETFNGWSEKRFAQPS